MSGPRRANGKADRLKRAYEAGLAAGRAGKPSTDNPFTLNVHRVAWERGRATTPPLDAG